MEKIYLEMLYGDNERCEEIKIISEHRCTDRCNPAVFNTNLKGLIRRRTGFGHKTNKRWMNKQVQVYGIRTQKFYCSYKDSKRNKKFNENLNIDAKGRCLGIVSCDAYEVWDDLRSPEGRCSSLDHKRLGDGVIKDECVMYFEELIGEIDKRCVGFEPTDQEETLLKEFIEFGREGAEPDTLVEIRMWEKAESK